MTAEDIAEVLSMWTGIPVYQFTEEESARLLRMEEEMKEHIVGQDEAITAISKAVRRARAGLKDPAPAHWFVHILGSHRCRQNGIDQSARSLPFWQ